MILLLDSTIGLRALDKVIAFHWADRDEGGGQKRRVVEATFSDTEKKTFIADGMFRVFTDSGEMIYDSRSTPSELFGNWPFGSTLRKPIDPKHPHDDMPHSAS